jgi:ribosomal protein L37AE/L43A
MTGAGQMPARERHCYLCGSHELVPVEVKRRIWRCNECGLAETEPSGGRASYDATYLAKQWTGDDPTDRQVERAVRAELARVRRVQRSAAGRRLLEIGSGHGYFLEAARLRRD